jgi:histidinol-phosphatase
VTTSLLEAAIELAKLTGDVALTHYRANQKNRGLAVETKADGSPVTIADRAAEEAARAFLAKYFPNDGVLGEELGATRPDAKRRWCIDPIDGTKSFIRGVPLWGSLVAVLEGEVVLAGAARFPVTGEAIAGAPGFGCVTEGVRAGVSDVASLTEATVLTTDERFPDIPECEASFRLLASRAKIARSWGDCYGYYLVATGRAELMTDGRLSPWDAACFEPIILEAGGVFTDWNGKQTSFGRGVIATNRGIDREARAILK